MSAPDKCNDERTKARSSNRHEMQVEDIGVATLNLFQQRFRRSAIEIDARDRRLRAFEDHVLGFLRVDLAGAQVLEDVREYTRAVEMADDEHVCRRRLLREVDDVRHLTGVLVAGD